MLNFKNWSGFFNFVKTEVSFSIIFFFFPEVSFPKKKKWIGTLKI